MRNRYTDDETGINITPMLDVMFVMLILFIVAISFLDEEDPGVSTLADAAPESTLAPVELTIDDRGQISVQGTTLESDVVYSRLARYRTEMPDSPLMITARADTPSAVLATVLDAARAAEFESVSVVTETDE